MEYVIILFLVVISALALVKHVQTEIKGCGGGCQSCQLSCGQPGRVAVRLPLEEGEDHVE